MTCESDLKFKLQFPQMKFCWNTITPVCFYMICGCLPTTTAELGCDGDRMAYKAQNIYCLALCRKSVPTPGPEPEERDRAWWAGQKAKGSRFHSTSTTSSHLNLMAAPWDRWDGRKLRNREVMPFPQGLIAGYWETNSHLSFSLWQVCPQCHIAPQLSDQSLYSCRGPGTRETFLMAPTSEQKGRWSTIFCVECYGGDGQGIVKLGPKAT